MLPEIRQNENSSQKNQIIDSSPHFVVIKVLSNKSSDAYREKYRRHGFLGFQHGRKQYGAIFKEELLKQGFTGFTFETNTQ